MDDAIFSCRFERTHRGFDRGNAFGLCASLATQSAHGACLSFWEMWERRVGACAGLLSNGRDAVE